MTVLTRKCMPCHATHGHVGKPQNQAGGRRKDTSKGLWERMGETE